MDIGVIPIRFCVSFKNLGISIHRFKQYQLGIFMHLANTANNLNGCAFHVQQLVFVRRILCFHAFSSLMFSHFIEQLVNSQELLSIAAVLKLGPEDRQGSVKPLLGIRENNVGIHTNTVL